MLEEKPIEEPPKPRPTGTTKLFMIGIAYGASIGGSASIAGALSNFALQGIFDVFFSKGDCISFGPFIMYGAPVALISTFIVFIWLNFMYGKHAYTDADSVEKAKSIIQLQQAELGSITVKEKLIFVIYVISIYVWFARDLGFTNGWSELFDKVDITNATPAVIALFLMFVLPAKWTICNFCRRNQDRPTMNSSGLVTWKMINECIPWGMVFMLGAGFTMTKAAQSSELSYKIGKAMEDIKDVPPFLVMFIGGLICQILSTFSASLAVASLMLPILAELSKFAKVHPIYFMHPAAICCSFAFMFPNAASPNAVIARLANIRTKDLVY